MWSAWMSFGPGHFRLGRLNEAAGVCGGRGPLWVLNRFWEFAAGRLAAAPHAESVVRGPERPQAEDRSVEGWGILLRVGGVDACGHTRGTRVPKHAAVSRLNTDYELSTRFFRATDLRRICCAVSFSMSTMVPPQRGQRQVGAGFASLFPCVSEHGCGLTFSNC